VGARPHLETEGAAARDGIQQWSSGSSTRGGGRSSGGWRPAAELCELIQRWREEQRGMASGGRAV
jgi:hypothetical protein